MRLNELERALLTAVIEREELPETSRELDLELLQAKERSMSVCGFMTTLCDTETAQLFATDVSLRLGDCTFAIVNSNEEVGVVVYVDGGKITALEGYTFGGRAWPDEVREFRIKHPSTRS